METFCSEDPSSLGRLEDAADSALVGVHEADHGGEDGPDAPAGAPGFFVEVREGGADELADLEASVVGEEADFGRREGVVFSELEYAMIEALLVLFL